MFRLSVTFSLLIVYATAQIFDEVSNDTSAVQMHGKSEILSRRKRFLIFPEGSSVQLVFCTTFPSVNVIGDIILWGYTAALAYELPQDPYSPFMHHADPLHRRVDTKEIYYTNEQGRIIYKQPYQRKFIVNPAFAKRSVDGSLDSGKKEDKFKIDRKQMHASSHRREFLKSSHMDAKNIEFHRSSRAQLYRKIETMLQGLGGNGKQCLLKTLCLVGQSQHSQQASFYQELLRAVFTLPKGLLEDPDFKDYDEAHLTKESCDDLYPECNQPISEVSAATVVQE